jgi:hypothetical protein
MILRTLKKTAKWIGLAMLVATAAAGGLMAWAAPPDGNDGVGQTAPGPAASNSGGVAAFVSVPASTPRPVPRIAIDAELMGTAVVEGGTSYAMFQLAGGTRLVREGEEITDGVRLVQVRRNRIDVERNGVHQEIRLGGIEGARQQVRPGSNPAGSGFEARGRLIEHLKAKGVLRQG